MLRSQRILQPTDIGKLSLFKSMGYSDFELKRRSPADRNRKSWNTSSRDILI
jgi:hypothetical protein